MGSLQLAEDLLGRCDVLCNAIGIGSARFPDHPRFAPRLQEVSQTLLRGVADRLAERSAPHPVSELLQAASEMLRSDLAREERATRAAALLIGVHDHIEKTRGARCELCRVWPQLANIMRDWAWSGLAESSKDEAIRKLAALEREA